MKIIYTHTDEAPALATSSLLPVIEAFAGQAGVNVELRDISLAARILARFADRLPESQQVPDALAELGQLAKTAEANIIKLPNVSASMPQLKTAIEELQGDGFAVPDYPENPTTDDEREVRARYDAIKGSAVNPVLREGNSDRRSAAAVKAYAQKHPHSMGEWSSSSRTNVVTMSGGDFRHTEQSVTIAAATDARIEHVAVGGEVTVLGAALSLEDGEVLDAAVMRRAALREFLLAEVADAKREGLLYSAHLKATMMKVSDPIIFGHVVETFVGPELFEQFPGASPNDGLASLLAEFPQAADAVQAALADGPDLYMVDSDRGITNLHVPSDVIIDASMPALIRASGQGWNARGEQQDTKCVIPDSSYAPLYAEAIEHCRKHGAFDPATMGATANVGLMAKKAEEYGSHETTFEVESAGSIRIVDAGGTPLLELEVSEGDIWRACRAKDAPIRDWVQLAVRRARASGTPAVFWLDQQRPHDRELLVKVREELGGLDTEGLEIEVMDVAEAARFTLERARAGLDTISVTGNVLRDYLTDLFPILELGTSAKMLSIVPLMGGGGLFETGAGGSAPKHVQQFLAENHLRWDSLGEFLALAESLSMLAEQTGNVRAGLLSDALGKATGEILEQGKSPSRKAGELDNRGSHFYLALYWAQQLAAQQDDAELAARFRPLADRLAADEDAIVAELAAVQGAAVEIGGYYSPDAELTSAAMRPSERFNAAIGALADG
jgi:isocitrate dehydrogenase